MHVDGCFKTTRALPLAMRSRDLFMAYKQDFILAFVDCITRNGASLAQNKLMVRGAG